MTSLSSSCRSHRPRCTIQHWPTMLPPSRHNWTASKAEYAGSILSFDSGYSTGDAAEGSSDRRQTHGIGNENVRLHKRFHIIEEDFNTMQFYLQASTSANSLQGRLNGPALDVGSSTSFTNRAQQLLQTMPAVPIADNQYPSTLFADSGAEDLSKTSTDVDCLSCDLWNLTNPGPYRKCESCQSTSVNTVEPGLLTMHSTLGERQGPSLRVFPAATTEISLDVLHSSTQMRCSACELSALIDPSGPPCSSCSPWSPDSSQSPISPKPKKFQVKRSHAGRNSKLPLTALNRLQGWLDQHQENPYPTALEKKQLALECGITEKQVATWFTNARARQLSPLDSYLASASEEEFAMESDIASAAQTPPYMTAFASRSTAAPYNGRAGSISGSSAFSASSRTQPSRRGKKKDYRKKKEQLPQIPQWIPYDQDTAQQAARDVDQELWQCTFCLAPLVPKSWRRHEETQHRPRSKWTCMLYGPQISVPNRSSASPCTDCCAFCMAANPSPDHFLHNHRILDCSKRPLAERTFFRPDHLRQHVRNFHGTGLHEIVQSRWKRGSESKDNDEGEGWICGFCGDTLRDWGVRESHISGHFKDGMRMFMWRTDWGTQSSRDQENANPECSHSQPERRDKGKEKEQGKEKEHGFARLTRTLSRLSTSTRSSLSRASTLKQASLSRSSTLKFGALSKSNTMRMLSRSPRQSADFENEMLTTSAVATPPLPEQQAMYSDAAPQGFVHATFLPQINTDPLIEDYGNFANHIETNPYQTVWAHAPVLQSDAYGTGLPVAGQDSAADYFAPRDGASFECGHGAPLGMMDGLDREWTQQLGGWEGHWGPGWEQQ